MHICHRVEEITSLASNIRKTLHSIGFVPTMGALHEGHLSLVKKALSECDSVVVSIFVNPTQFDNAEDLEKYPRTLESDINLLKTVSNKLIVFAPEAKDVYSNNIVSKHFNFNGLEFQMEGKQRKGHFDGVGTIVKRLFEIVTPDRAYFGEKDFQQLQIIRTLVRKYEIPVKIIGCPIKREAHGLAMSSRNERLSPELRKEAGFIFSTLQKARVQFQKESASRVKKWVETTFKENKYLELEYVEIAQVENLQPVIRKRKNKKYRIFIAAYAGPVRLIDNIALN